MFFRVMVFIIGLLFLHTGFAVDRFERIAPEQAGYSKEKLFQLEQELVKLGSSSMLLLYDGKVFFEYGDIYKKHTVHSIRKALLNSLLGIAWGEQQFSLDTPISEVTFLNLDKNLNEIERNATLEMIFKSRSGIYLPAAAESDGMKQLKPERGTYLPGEHYYYNNWDFNFAGHFYEQLTGQNIYQAFYEKIAKPLGMKHYKGEFSKIETSMDAGIPDSDGFYFYEPGASTIPAYHFRLSAHDLALYGQLYLNFGKWDGKQIIPQQWIDMSTQPYSITNADYGLAYGMLWSVLVPDDGQARASFYHTGTGVHMLGVYPSLKLVMVHRVNTEQPYQYHGGNLYQIIRLMHDARVKQPSA